MGNLSQIRRAEMLEYLNHLKEIHTDDESRIALSKIETVLTEKKYEIWRRLSNRTYSITFRTNVFMEKLNSNKVLGEYSNFENANFALIFELFENIVYVMAKYGDEFVPDSP